MNSFRSSNKQLSLFTTAGYPQLDSLNEQLSIMEAAGIDFVEVGIPFSDPLADGPVINFRNAPLVFLWFSWGI